MITITRVESKPEDIGRETLFTSKIHRSEVIIYDAIKGLELEFFYTLSEGNVTIGGIVNSLLVSIFIYFVRQVSLYKTKLSSSLIEKRT